MKDLLTRDPSKDEKPFDVYWVKPRSGGGCDTFMGVDILDALKKFYEYWGGCTIRPLCVHNRRANRRIINNQNNNNNEHEQIQRFQ